MLNVYNTTLVSSWQAVDCLAVPRAQEHTLTTTQNLKPFSESKIKISYFDRLTSKEYL